MHEIVSFRIMDAEIDIQFLVHFSTWMAKNDCQIVIREEINYPVVDR